MLLNAFCHYHRAYASSQLLGRKLPLNWGCPITVYSGVFLLSYFVWSFTEASGLAFAEDTTLGWKDHKSLLLPTSDISGAHKTITFLLAGVRCWQTSTLWFKWFSFFCNVSMSFGLRFSFWQEIMFTKPLKEIKNQTKQLFEIKMYADSLKANLPPFLSSVRLGAQALQYAQNVKR